MPQLPYTPRLLRELFGVGPGQFGELLDGDPAAVLEAAFVHKIVGFFAAFRDYEVGAEVVGGSFEVC